MSKLAKIALVLVIFLAAIPAMTISEDGYRNSIISGADRLVATQNSDGGWPWVIPGASTTNTLGVTALGVLEAYRMTGDSDYMTSMDNAYAYAASKAPVYTGTEETTNGVDSCPDFVFFVKLSKLTHDSKYATLAKQRYDYKRDSVYGSATAWAEHIRDARIGQGYSNGIIPWDIDKCVKAAIALDEYYPGQGYDNDAEDMAQVIYDAMYPTSGDPIFDAESRTEGWYTLGLSGAVNAFSVTDVGNDKVNDLINKLISCQRIDGSFIWSGEYADEGDVQSTAYAVMELVKIDEIGRAIDGADWLIRSQSENGGWIYLGDEYAEVNGEATYAIALVMSNAVWIRDLDERLTYLEGRVDALRGDFTTFQTETENRLSVLEAWKTTLTDTIDNILSRLSAIEEWIEEHGGEVPPAHYCGDGVCDDDETAETCPQDCQEAPPGEVFLEENWDVTCPTSGYVYCRVELWKDGWLLNDNIILEPGQNKRVNHYAGYNMKMFGVPE